MTGRKSKTLSHSSTPASSEPTLSKHQAFTAETVHRSQLRNATYNPRVIDSYARAKLKKSIKKAGLVETLVWNRRTGNLVGGHQRVSVLDELEGTQDYLLTVAVIDVDDAKEREINVSLNNVAMQGAYDEQMLSQLLSDAAKLGEELDNDILGFDATELKLLKGEEIFAGSSEAGQADKETIDKIKGATARTKEREATKTDADANHYLVIVFSHTAELNKFREQLKLKPDEQYFDGELIAQRAGFTLRG